MIAATATLTWAMKKGVFMVVLASNRIVVRIAIAFL